MKRYIDAEKLLAEIERLKKHSQEAKMEFMKEGYSQNAFAENCRLKSFDKLLSFITSLQQEQPDNMIQWTGSNLQEVIDFTGKSPKFNEWFKSWDEFESYVHSHGDILKIFSEDGSHFEVSAGAWIVKTPDGYNVPSIARFIQAKQEQPEVDLEKAARNVYESWMGGTMDNVRQDMVELGKVLNARKEE